MSFNRIIDDLEINANAGKDDGPGGILGYAYVSGYRAGSYMPYRRYMMFDALIWPNWSWPASWTRSSSTRMATWSVWGPCGTIWAGERIRTNDPRFTGPAATAEYNAIFGNTETSVY